MFVMLFKNLQVQVAFWFTVSVAYDRQLIKVLGKTLQQRIPKYLSVLMIQNPNCKGGHQKLVC